LVQHEFNGHLSMPLPAEEQIGYTRLKE